VNLDAYREIWCVDFEFHAPPGERPNPICMVAREYRSGRTIKLLRNDFGPWPPFPTDAETLFVAYYASAELGCFLALDWPLPERVLDLFTEFRNLRNGLPVPCGWGLRSALIHFGLESISAAEKDAGRDLAMRGGPWTEAEKRDLLDYCATDVEALCQLLPRMVPGIDLPRAQLRGRYMAAAARIEATGVPIDCAALSVLRSSWDSIKAQLITEIDRAYHVFENQTFKADRFECYLIRNAIAWPRLESGQLDLSDDTFRQISKHDPRISPLRELRSSLAQLRLADLCVGSDGRNRALLSAFRSRTGRNQPSNAKFIFGPSVWLRNLIKPPPGRAIAYLDWSAQEYGIGASLSGDRRMIDAYTSGDPYLTFAKQTGAAPPDATKFSHKPIREQYKAVVLGVGYGMEAETLAGRIGVSELEARELLLKHRMTYPQFWEWSDGIVSAAMLTLQMRTVFGWTLGVGVDVNPRSVRNFPMQANGAEMLRLACILGTERGIEICAPVHDAILIEAPISEIEAATERMRGIMQAASRIVLAGFELRTDAEIVRYPQHYSDPRGTVMWDRVWGLINSEKGPAHVGG
jgi:DNA polymerase I